MALRDIEAEVAFEDWVVDDLSSNEDRDIDDLADVRRQVATRSVWAAVIVRNGQQRSRWPGCRRC